VLAGLEGGDDLGLVEVVGRADDDGVDVVGGEQLLVAPEDVRDGKASGDGRGLLAIDVAHALDTGAREIDEEREVDDLGDGAGAEHTDPELAGLVHGVSGRDGRPASARSGGGGTAMPTGMPVPGLSMNCRPPRAERYWMLFMMV
jgi:hypothetical protein